MLMSRRTRTCFHFPPNNHSLPSCEDAAFDFIGDPLPRQFRKCAEARYHWHDIPSYGRIGGS
jgi:hypothetical protein